jgi:hypothetical protein
MNAEQQEQAANANAKFAKVIQYLHAQGYTGPHFTTGHPISLLAGEPVHARFDTTGTTDAERDFQVARHNLDYAQLGFHVTKGQGFLSIQHTGETPTHISIPIDHAIQAVVGPVYQSQHGVNVHVHPDTHYITIVATIPMNPLTPEQARQLADTIQKASHL